MLYRMTNAYIIIIITSMRPPSAFVYSFNSNNVIDSIGQPPERHRKMQCLPRSCAVTKLARDFEGNIKPRQRHGEYGVKNYAKSR